MAAVREGVLAPAVRLVAAGGGDDGTLGGVGAGVQSHVVEPGGGAAGGEADVADRVARVGEGEQSRRSGVHLEGGAPGDDPQADRCARGVPGHGRLSEEGAAALDEHLAVVAQGHQVTGLAVGRVLAVDGQARPVGVVALAADTGDPDVDGGGDVAVGAAGHAGDRVPVRGRVALLVRLVPGDRPGAANVPPLGVGAGGEVVDERVGGVGTGGGEGVQDLLVTAADLRARGGEVGGGGDQRRRQSPGENGLDGRELLQQFVVLDACQQGLAAHAVVDVQGAVPVVRAYEVVVTVVRAVEGVDLRLGTRVCPDVPAPVQESVAADRRDHPRRQTGVGERITDEPVEVAVLGVGAVVEPEVLPGETPVLVVAGVLVVVIVADRCDGAEGGVRRGHDRVVGLVGQALGEVLVVALVEPDRGGGRGLVPAVGLVDGAHVEGVAPPAAGGADRPRVQALGVEVGLQCGEHGVDVVGGLGRPRGQVPHRHLAVAGTGVDQRLQVLPVALDEVGGVDVLEGAGVLEELDEAVEVRPGEAVLSAYDSGVGDGKALEVREHDVVAVLGEVLGEVPHQRPPRLGERLDRLGYAVHLGHVLRGNGARRPAVVPAGGGEPVVHPERRTVRRGQLGVVHRHGDRHVHRAGRALHGGLAGVGAGHLAGGHRHAVVVGLGGVRRQRFLDGVPDERVVVAGAAVRRLLLVTAADRRDARVVVLPAHGDP